MSDDLSNENNAKLSNSDVNLHYLDDFEEQTEIEDINSSYDHMYATNHEENGLLEEEKINDCQSAESEVNFLKDFLLIHLELIQQQNDDILNKENDIYILQQENAELREKLSCMETGLPYEATTSSSPETSNELSPETITEDMTLDSGPVNDITNTVDIPETELIQPTLEIKTSIQETIHDNHIINEIKIIEDKIDFNLKEDSDESPEKPCSTNDFNDYDHTEVNYSNSRYTIHSNSFDSSNPMRNLKMSIRRKRLCSNSSSILSNNDSTSEDKRRFRRSRKKRKRLVKNDQIHTYPEQYFTQVDDILRRQKLAEEAARAALINNLEVPRWRVKVYTSCYSMEGTENLEDEVFLRRHNRHENDERRRKRWDVQRIREQRLVEKLKQRQDKIDSHKQGNDQSETIESLWPSLDEIKYVEVNDVLPVSAFGYPIPKIQHSEFSLPWLTCPNLKKMTRRSTARRRGK